MKVCVVSHYDPYSGQYGVIGVYIDEGTAQIMTQDLFNKNHYSKDLRWKDLEFEMYEVKGIEL